jgi:hypothetical protein
MLSLLGLGLIGWLGLAGCSGSNNSNPDGGDGGTGCNNPCETFNDCAATEDCQAGCCKRSTRCTQDATCQPSGVCVDGRCVGLCINDGDCPDRNLCIDGFCTPYPTDAWEALTAPPPDADHSQKHPLQVGIGDVPLDFPVGVSMAGYGARVGPRTPYRKTLGGSERFWDRPRVKAYVFDNGLKRVALVRPATSWSTDYLISHTAWRLYQATGQNWVDRIITVANHTHSYPGRYSFWIPTRSMGVLGHGDYSQEIFHRHSDAIAKAILAAIDDLQPARVGWTYVDAMDPEHKVHRYRRGEWPIEMDDSLVTLRIDDDQGNPRALLFNFALHGTHTDDTAVTGDAPGAVELIAQSELQELTGLPVVATFLSGNSGDVSPAGDGTGLDDWRKIQEVGHQAWPILKAQFEALEGQTTADVDLDTASIRAPINREALGYGPGEFIDEDGNEYLFGAFQCAGSGDEDPETMHQDGQLGCIFSAQMLSGGVPVPDFCKVRISLLKINDLGFVTVPGEPASDFGRGLAQAYRDAGFAAGHVLGYSQDHHLYVMHEDNWLQGGYEPSMGIWGWAEGDYFYSLAIEGIDRFASQGGFSEANGVLPSWYEWHDDTVAPTPTAAGQAGQVVQDVPETIERTDLITFQWTGGHPGVDLPSFTLERQDGPFWVKMTNAAGITYSDDLHSSMTWYLGDYEADHTWSIEWEEDFDFPAGTYRMRVDGNFFDGGGTQPYTTLSRTFELRPSSRLVITAIDLQAERVAGAVLYPAGPTNDDGSSAFSELQARGYLHLSGRVPETLPSPVPVDGSVTVSVSIEPPMGPALQLTDIPVSTESPVNFSYVRARAADGTESQASANLPAGRFEVAHSAGANPGVYRVTVAASDAHGNTGQTEIQITIE